MTQKSITWVKTEGCTLLTEVGKVNKSDVGYIYQDDDHWVAVYIYENGQEDDRFCHSNKEAKQKIYQILEMEKEEGYRNV